MPELLAVFDAFLQEHRCCGELDSGVENAVVWMCCTRGAQILRVHNPREMPT